MTHAKRNIKLWSFDELAERLSECGLKKYRARQIFEWIFKKYALSFDEMTNISKADREYLSANFFISSSRIAGTEVSRDSTVKFLLELEDHSTIESVLIPDEDRLTLCISTQVGCAQACRFCLTGKGGFQRNLAAHEIVDQILAGETWARAHQREGANNRPPVDSSSAEQTADRVRAITNIVLMGMGEPLANFEEVTKALRCISANRGLAFSPRRITLSTAGLVPEINALGKTGVNVNLAISLNATTDEVRDMVMPINKRYPMKTLLAACRRYPLEPRRRITFEYVMLGGLNDFPEDAQRLVTLCKGIPCKINLIPFNPFPESEFARPEESRVLRFKKILHDAHVMALIRNSRGGDISAACGMLRGRTRKKELRTKNGE